MASKKTKFEFDKNKFYSVSEAVDLAIKSSTTKFVSSIDIAIKLNLDTTKAEQQLRGSIALPNYFGKVSKILVIDSNLTQKDASKLGVDYAGSEDKINEIERG